MPAAVIDRVSDVTDAEADLVRAALDRLGEDDRRSLWSCLELIDNVITAGGDRRRIDNAIALAPYDVRPTVARVAALRLERAGVAPRRGTPDAGRLPTRRVTTFTGRAADHDTWTSTHWSWSSFSADALDAAVERDYGPHPVVPVLYRHAGEPLGVTRRWYLSDGTVDGSTGDLNLEAMLLPFGRGRLAGYYVSTGHLQGLSLGVQVLEDDWSYLSPREWEPREGRLDLQRRERIRIAEVSITPTPAQHGATIRNYW